MDASALPWEVAEALAEHGHLDLLRREAGAGDYACADAAARLLQARGEPAAALALLRPFLDTGWAWRATDHITAILVQQGDDAAATAMLRPFADEGRPEAVRRLGMLLVRHGRDDEVLAMLRQGLADVLYPVDVVVELTRGLGRDEEVIGLLRSRLDTGPGGIEGLLASVLDRAGRPGEAITVLTEYLREGSYDIADDEKLADLLARHDPATLTDLAGTGGHPDAARRLARLYEDEGRIDDAVAVLAPLAGRLRRQEQRGFHHYPPETWPGYTIGSALRRNETWLLADLLARHGRVEEAITVLRPAASIDPVLVRPLCVLLINHGRPDEARAVVAGFVAEFVAEGWQDPVMLHLEWIEALVESGRHEQAIAELRADPAATSGYARERLAALLTGFGSPHEAVALLGPDAEGSARGLLVDALIRAGRPEDAIAARRAVPIEVV